MNLSLSLSLSVSLCNNELIIHPLHRKGDVLFYLCPSFRSSRDIFRRIFLSNYWWQKSDIWSESSYRYPISWEAFLKPSHSYFLIADLVGFYAHWTYMQGYHKWALPHSSSCFNYDIAYASLLYVVNMNLRVFMSTNNYFPRIKIIFS